MVPGANNEYYDCCTSRALDTCRVLGTIDLVYFGILLIIFSYCLYKVKWLQHQYLIISVFIFQFIAFLCKRL